MYDAIRDGMDRRANGSRQVDAVVEVPPVSVDTRSEGRVHFVWRGTTLAERPDEVGVALSGIR